MSLTFPAPRVAISFLTAANAQIEAIADAYETVTVTRTARPEAVWKLLGTVETAVSALITGSFIRRRYPAIYEGMARDGKKWLLVHRC